MSAKILDPLSLTKSKILDPFSIIKQSNNILGIGSDDVASTTSASSSATNAPATMPIADSAAIAQAKRRSISAQIARRGRASTILTGDQSAGEKLGG